MVLHRGRGPGGRVAALAPVGHLPVFGPNCADALNPHTRERGLQHAGSQPTTGVPRSDCGAEHHGVEFIVRPGNRPGSSLTANREGRPRGATPSASGAGLAFARNPRVMCARHGPAWVVTYVVA